MTTILLGLNRKESEELLSLGKKTLAEITEEEFSRYNDLIKRALMATADAENSVRTAA